MAGSKSAEDGAMKHDGLTVIALPPDKAQQVLEFVASLESDDADVSGYMLSGAGSLVGGSLAAAGNQKHATGTGCLSSPTGWKCSDVDRTPGDE